MNFYMPVPLVTGPGCVLEQGARICSFGSKCLIVTGKTSARKSGALQDVISVLEKGAVEYGIFDGIAQNPTVDSCLLGGEAARQMGAEFVIGIGGGSALDAAKVIALAARQPMIEEDLYSGVWPERMLPVILVGTTAGTGSEVTDVSVLTDSRHRKHSVHDSRLYASLALGDPRYTESLPRSVTLSTGVDALAHCTESYFSRKANPISRALALEGMKLLLSALPQAVDGAPPRQALYEASILGGLAISVTGTVFPHNVGYYLSENYNVPHGIACAVFLPELLGLMEGTKEAAAFYASLGTNREELTRLIESTLPVLDITMTAPEIDACLPRWENNGSVKNALCSVTTDMIKSWFSEKFMA